MRFVPKGPTRLKILYLKLQLFSVTSQNEFLKCINLKESDDSLKHQSSVIHSFMLIHSVVSENDKNVPLIVCDPSHQMRYVGQT